MTKQEFENLNREQMIIAFNQLKEDYSGLFKDYEKAKEYEYMYKDLCR